MWYYLFFPSYWLGLFEVINSRYTIIVQDQLTFLSVILQARVVLINAGQANAATVSACHLCLIPLAYMLWNQIVIRQKELFGTWQGDAGYQDTVECANAVAEVFQVLIITVLLIQINYEYICFLLIFFCVIDQTASPIESRSCIYSIHWCHRSKN